MKLTDRVNAIKKVSEAIDLDERVVVKRIEKGSSNEVTLKSGSKSVTIKATDDELVNFAAGLRRIGTTSFEGEMV